MNKVAVFTQTYGNNIQEIFVYRIKDKNFIDFIKNFDSFLCFHNCSDDTINLLKEKQLGTNNWNRQWELMWLNERFKQND
jgi:hypothetical protein